MGAQTRFRRTILEIGGVMQFKGLRQAGQFCVLSVKPSTLKYLGSLITTMLPEHQKKDFKLFIQRDPNHNLYSAIVTKLDGYLKCQVAIYFNPRYS